MGHLQAPDTWVLSNYRIDIEADLKISKCRKEMLDTYMPIEVERIQAQVMAYQWVQAGLQDIVIENESKDTKIRI